MRRLLSLSIISSLVLLSGCATNDKDIQGTNITTEKCEAPIWNVGDKWKWQDNLKRSREHVVKSIEPGYYVVESRYSKDKQCFNRKNLDIIAFINPEGKTVPPSVPSTVYFEFPLYVGREYNRMVSARPSGPSSYEVNYANEYKVISYEDVTVLAGTFKAFKIRFKQTNFTAFNSGIAWIWYSAQVKNRIKFVTDGTGFWLSTNNDELSSFTLSN